jgi:hypothetical protein
MNEAIMTDTVLSQSAVKYLVDKFGIVDTERFLSLINKERFDYTEWQRDLFDGMTAKEILRAASEWKKNRDNNENE